MEVDVVTNSINTMKLTEPEIKSFKEKWWHVDAMVNFNIESVKELLRTPEHDKDRSHYYFETMQVRLLEEKLRNLEKHERNNVYGDYSKTKEFQDLKRSARYWLQKISKESIVLKKRLGISGKPTFHTNRTLKTKTKSTLNSSSNT